MEGADDIAALVPPENRKGAGGEPEDIGSAPALERRLEGEEPEGANHLVHRLLDRGVTEPVGEPDPDRAPFRLGELRRGRAGRPPESPDETVDEEAELRVRLCDTVPDPEPERRSTAASRKASLDTDEPLRLESPQVGADGVPVDARKPCQLGDGAGSLREGLDDREPSRIAEETVAFGTAKELAWQSPVADRGFHTPIVG